MIVPEWVPPVAAMLAVQVFALAFFAGGMRTELRLLKEQVEGLAKAQGTADIAVLKSRAEGWDAWRTHADNRFEEAFRQIAALTRGTRARPMQVIENGD